MAASITDKFTRSTDSSTARPVTAQIAAPGKALAAPTVNLNIATNWVTSTAVHVSFFKVNAQGYKDPTTQTDWKATLSGTTLSNLTPRGGSDQTYVAGDYAEITPTDGWLKDLIDGILAQHTQLGAHTNITTDNITATGVVTLPNNAIDANELSASAITLGYAQRTSTFSTGSTSPVQATSLSSTVTIPAGGRRIKITAWCPEMTSGASNSNAYMSIWDGAVNAGGTQLAYSTTYAGSSVIASSGMAIAVVTPSAGSKTYNVGFNVASGTGSMVASASAPSFILVEAI